MDADGARLARFQREAEVLAALNHPHIAAVYGLEELPVGMALVMELVEGETLADRIARAPVPIDEALGIAGQIAEALEAAHDQGIVHRDLKPARRRRARRLGVRVAPASARRERRPHPRPRSFPRTKLCAGWITPEVVSDLEIEPGEYPGGWLRFERLHLHRGPLGLRQRAVQYSIRRFEFDAWLAPRSGARVLQHYVRDVRRDADGYALDGAFRARFVVGRRRHALPGHRSLFRTLAPRAHGCRP